MRTITSAFGSSKVGTNFGFSSDEPGKQSAKLDLTLSPGRGRRAERRRRAEDLRARAGEGDGLEFESDSAEDRACSAQIAPLRVKT